MIYDDGHWIRFSSRVYGPDFLSLLIELLGGEVVALQFAEQWLAEHPGLGAWEGIDTEDGQAKAEANAEKARHWLSCRVPHPGTPAELYFRNERRFSPRAGLESTVSYVPDVRLGEGAVIGTLIDSARPDIELGLQLGFLDPLGRHIRNRKGSRDRWMLFATLDPDARRRACFRIPAAASQEGVEAPGDDTGLSATIVCEGLENTVAVATACPEALVVGLPGISRLATIAITGNVVVLRDNDGDEAPATKALLRGLDALKLAGQPIKVTDTPEGRDAADYAGEGQLSELRQLILDAQPYELTLDGKLTELARLSPLDYAQKRKQFAKRK